jgi:outer membrane murein-binding lipoprotein Lpp
VADDKAGNEPTLVERWVQDQQQWQKTVMTYLDSMVKNDDFLVHLGNAMRGSLLAGKPYPTAPPPAAAPQEPVAQDKFDQILFALHQLEGQVQDLRMTLDAVQDRLKAAPTSKAPKAAARNKKAAAPAKAKGRRITR